MKLVLLGAPGSGKGTLAKGLIKEFGIPSISTGDLLRNSIEKQEPLGLEAKSYMEKGQLVPTELVLKLLKERLNDPDTKNGYILDGFPRSIEQAVLLEDIDDMDICLYLDVDKQVIVERITGRRTCKDCGNIYNTSTYHSEKCECGGELYLRTDDNEETVSKRFDTFESNTMPLIQYYKGRGIFKTVKGQNDPKQTLEEALKVLNIKKKINNTEEELENK